MNIDVIILTRSDNDKTISMTRRMMLTMQDSEPSHRFYFHLVESGNLVPDRYIDLVTTYITPKENFNYNRYINFAIPYLKHDWLVISNNDVSYERGWFSEIMKIHEQRPDIHSFSPRDPLFFMRYYDGHFVGNQLQYFESYKVSEALMGWCIVIKKESFDKIAPLDELFDMYYQDNDFAMMLQANGIKHALVRNSIVSHLQTITVTNYTDSQRRKMQIDEIKFRTKWNQLK